MRARPKNKSAKAAPLFTIGYEQAKPGSVLGELKRAKIKLLVDTRAVAASRRPGFSKRQLAAALEVLVVELVLGSTTDRVLRAAAVPVLLAG